jgi:hypothetical protein
MEGMPKTKQGIRSPRTLLRLMLSFGDSMFGILVTTAGLVVRAVHRRHRLRIAIGSGA